MKNKLLSASAERSFFHETKFVYKIWNILQILVKYI